MKLRKLLDSAGFKKVASNFSWLMIMQLVDKLVPLLVIPYLISTLGFERWGVIGFAQSFGMYVLILMDYGFAQTALRDISQHRDDGVIRSRIFQEVIWAKIALGLLGLAASLVLAWSVPLFRPNFVLFAGAVLLYFGQSMFPVWFWQGMEQMKISTLLSSISRLVFLGLIFLLVHQPEDQALVLWLQAAGAWVGALAGIILAMSKYQIPLVFPDFSGMLKQFRTGAPVFLSNLSISLYTTTRGFMIGLVSSETLMGYYYLAEKLVSLLGIPFAMVAQSLYPRLARLWQDAPQKFLSHYRKLLVLSASYALLLIPFALATGPWFLDFLSHGKTTRECINLFSILVLILLFQHSNAFRIQALLISHNNQRYLRIHLVGGICGMVLVVGLSLTAGPWGTTWAAVGAEALVFGLSLMWGQKKSILGASPA